MTTTNQQGFRLSPQQKFLWLLQQSDHQNGYRAQGAILIKGNLDVVLLKEAWQQVVNRHEILRSAFHSQSGIRMPFQVIADAVKTSWRELDISEWEQQKQQEKLDEVFQEEKCRPFHFDQPSLFHLLLVILSPTSHVLLVSLPSLCADAWTINNLAREISRSYEAFLKGEEIQDEPLQYADYSEWQNELLETEDEDARLAKAYWQEHNSPFSSLHLPFECRARQQETPGPDSFAFVIDPNLGKNLEAVARNYHASVKAYLLACWQTLLWRLTEKSEIVVGSVFDGRKYEELHEALGLFAKCIPLRCKFQAGVGFSEILERIHKNIADAYDWQEYYQSDEGLAFTEDTLPLALGYEFQDRPSKSYAGSVSFSVDKQYSWIYPFKLKLSCIRIDDCLRAEFRYDSEIFQANGIELIANYFQSLLRSSVENPETPVNELQVVSTTERYKLVAEFNRTAAEFPQDRCIHELIEQQAERTPEAIAVVSDDQQLAYSELNSRANQLAHVLRKLGVGPEVRVGLCLERSAQMFIGILGILKAGGAYVPLNPEHPKSRLAYQIADVQALVLLTERQLLSRLPDFAGEVICLDYDQSFYEQAPKTNLAPAALPQNLCYVIYTSGSTGLPKGVAVTHQNLVNYTHAICTKLGLNEPSAEPGLNFATVSTITADLGNTCIFPSLVSGGCLHIANYEIATEGERFARFMAKYAIDVLKIVPSHLNALLASQEGAQILPRKYLILGGEALSFDLAERVEKMAGNCQIINHYGPTETTVGSLTYRLRERDEVEWLCPSIPIGRPIANTQAYILDKDLQPVPVGLTGELYIGGSGLARGYVNQPEQTAERFIPDLYAKNGGARLYKTGDLARRLADETIEFIGRVDNQVKIRGYRIEPGEIEAVLARHPAISQSVVTACGSPPEDIRLVAYVLPAQVLAIDELREWLRAELPEYMMPSQIVMLKAFPLTANGKVDRRALPAPEQVRTEFVAPRTAIEEAVAQVWAELLKVEQVSIHDNFFDLGGHSLLVTQVVSRIRKIFQVEMSLRVFFESPTVAALAERIRLLEEETSLMLTEIESLSEEEAQQLLQIENQGDDEEDNMKAFSSGL